MTLAHEEIPFTLTDPGAPLRTLHGRITYPRGAERARPRPCVVALHGFKGFMDWGFWPAFARRLAGRGFAVVRFNFSGSGHTDAEPFEAPEAFFANTPSRELEDLERVRTWLTHAAPAWLDARRVALVGHSLGGGVALVHAARRGDYRALVGWAAVSTFRRFPREVEALWRRQGYFEVPNLRTQEIHRMGTAWLDDIEAHASKLDVRAACARLTTPVLLLHGTQDEAVPLTEGEALRDACRPGLARLEVLPGANHTFQAVHPLQGLPAQLGQVFHKTEEFLVTHLGDSRSTG